MCISRLVTITFPPSLLPSFSPLLLLSPHPPSLALSHFECQYFVFQGHAQWSGEWQISGETERMVPSHSLFSSLTPQKNTPMVPPPTSALPQAHMHIGGINGGIKTVIQTSYRKRKDGRTVDDDLDWCFDVDELLSSSYWMPLQLSRWDKSFYISDADESGNKVFSLANRLHCVGIVFSPDEIRQRTLV